MVVFGLGLGSVVLVFVLRSYLPKSDVSLVRMVVKCQRALPLSPKFDDLRFLMPNDVGAKVKLFLIHPGNSGEIDFVANEGILCCRYVLDELFLQFLCRYVNAHSSVPISSLTSKVVLALTGVGRYHF